MAKGSAYRLNQLYSWRCAIAGILLANLTGCAEPRVDLSTYLTPSESSWNSPWHAPQPVLDENIQLIGMDASNVVALFGKPSLQRRESDAQYWRYSFAGCVVDIYVYQEDGGERDEVVHYALRDPAKVRHLSGPSPSCDALERRLVRAPEQPRKERPAGSRGSLAFSSYSPLEGGFKMSANRAWAEPGLSACCWLGSGAQPVRNNRSIVTRALPRSSQSSFR